MEERRLLAADVQAIQADEFGRFLIGYHGQSPAAVQHSPTDQQAMVSILAALRSDPSVRYAEPDYRVQAAVVPNDPRFSSTWGLNNSSDTDVDAPEAWDITTGSMKTTVAVIDSGIDYTHPDLYQNIWLNQGEIPTTVKSQLVDVDGDTLITFRDLNNPLNQGAGKITDQNSNGRIDGGDVLTPYRNDGLGGWADGASSDGDSYVDDLIGWNFITDSNDPYDDNGHGTHVAGTIGAQGNNDIGVSGLLWNVQLVGLKFLDAAGGGYTSSAVAALNYAVSKSIEISNNSWGGGGYSQALFDAISGARAAGHIFIAAAGNGGSDKVGDNNNTVASYPANYNLDNVVAVAATDRYDRLAGFSNYGSTTVDLAAPGVGILSTVPGGGYGSKSGTSMATPHVTGAVALAMTQYPDWTYSQVIAQLFSKTDAIPELSGKVVTGGRLNAFNVLHSSTTATDPLPNTAPRIVAATPNIDKNGGVNGVRVTFSEAMNPATFTTADISSFTGPNGAMSVKSVAVVPGSANKQFDVNFKSKTAAGNYTLNIGSQVLNVNSVALDQDQDGVPGEATDDAFAASFTVNPKYSYRTRAYAEIRDGYATRVDINVDRDLTISDLNVKLDVSHTYDGDLVMYLTGPDGTTTDLIVFRGGSGDNFTATTLNDEAGTAIADGLAPFKGAFRPEQLLSAFDGKNAKGTWTLTVEDWYQGYTGRVNSVSLVISSVSSGNAMDLALSEPESEPEFSGAMAGAIPNATSPTRPASSHSLPAATPVSSQKDRLVDAFFATVSKHGAEIELADDSHGDQIDAATSNDSFSWDSVIDAFMASLAE